MAANPHFRIAGIPVRIEPVFWLVTAFLAFNLSDARLIIIWVAVVLVSILVHELGHAFALKAFGQPSSIVLHGFGGVTLSQRRLSKARSILVSLAGSVTALAVLGIPALLLRDSDLGRRLAVDYAFSDQAFGWWPVIYFTVYVNIWWSIANLLPIRPLDGGNVMTELVGLQRARLVSVGVGAAGAVWAYFHADTGLRYAALFAGFLAFINLSEYRRDRQGSAFDVDGPAPPGDGRGGRGGTGRGPTGRAAGRPTRPPTRSPASGPTPVGPAGIDPAAAESMVWNQLRNDDVDAARRTLARTSGEVGPFVRPTVELASGGGADALAQAYLAHPGGPSNLVPATVAADRGQALFLARTLAGRGPAGVEAAAGLQTHLHYADRFEHAAAVGEVVFPAADGSQAQVAFDTACGWSRAGDPDRGLEWIRRAIEVGFRSPALLDGEPDLAAVRARPGWAAVRATLA